MKKVAIISRHAISNYGSLLQAYALEHVIHELGYNAYTIDYIRTEEKSWHLCKVELGNSRWNANAVKRLLFYCVNVPNRTIQFAKFSRFRKRLLNLTREYNSFDELKMSPPSADIFCTGSDQVWNETIYNKLDWSYFLSFLGDEKRIAYAASFGKGTVNNEVSDLVKDSLEKYKKISVREDSGVDILNKIGLNGKVVLDPTLLLDRNAWESLIDKRYTSKDRYVLLYQIHKNEKLVEYACKFAELNGLKVINVNVSYTQRKKGIQFEWLPDYKKLLTLFRDASYIITDSFHATAFSINFSKQFVTMLPELSAARIKSILSIMGLEHRVISENKDYELPKESIDYDIVNSLLQKYREQSIDWLKEALKESIGD